jgi:hypothetical protein
MAWVVGIGIFLFLLCAFPKQIGSIALLIVACCIIAWLYSDAQSKAAVKLRAKITISVSIGSGCNDPQYPISVSISNGTNKRINSVYFKLSARRPGFSSEIYSYTETSDRILNPGDRYIACWSLSSYEMDYGKIKGEDIRALSWSARLSSVNFAE